MEKMRFLSVVLVVRNQANHVRSLLENVTTIMAMLAVDYEITVVDNGSDDDSVARLKSLTREDGIANLQVFSLLKEMDIDAASWVGVENALGDFVVVIDPTIDDIGFIPKIVEQAALGADVVFAVNQHQVPMSPGYRVFSSLFYLAFKVANGLRLDKEAPSYRGLRKKVINHILQNPVPELAFRHLPASAGFAKSYLNYASYPTGRNVKKLRGRMDRAIRLLVSTTRTPLRAANLLCIFGAFANIVYSIFVVIVAVFKDDVAPGWVSLSLQQSGMFFLLSLVLLVLSEYILYIIRINVETGGYYIAQEFSSAKMGWQDKLNIKSTKDDRPEMGSADPDQ